MQQVPPLHVAEVIQWKGKSQYTWRQRRRRSCQNELKTTTNCLGGSNSRFILRVNSRSLSHEQVSRKAAEVYRSWPSLSWTANIG